MAAKLINGKKIAAQIKSEITVQVRKLKEEKGILPGLAAILVGDNPASKVYVESKTKACHEAGIFSETIRRPETTKQEDLEALIRSLNDREDIHGILVQLPLPSQINEQDIIELVAPGKDIDGFHPVNMGKLSLGRTDGFVPCTPKGILELIKREGIDPSGKNAVIIGRSNIVGKPLALLLIRHHATVTVCHTRTRNLEEVASRADILVAAAGRPGVVGADCVGPGAVVIDVGVNRIDDPAEAERLFAGYEKKIRAFKKRGAVLSGDVDFVRASEKAGAITPVPGGVGPMTIAMLLANTVRAAEQV
jgi:methylenetetrahydrofolate dehydrogenase (NADP+)/methenyltetrahydrofolate cyclohydrolase